MADKTKIEWTDATWNPITGCSLVSEGCRNCYAAELAATRLRHHTSRAGLAVRNAAGVAKFTGEVRFNEQWLAQPLTWKKPRRIFVCAHGDLFHEGVPDAWIDRVFAVMALCPQHTFQVLTKRPERMYDYVSRLGFYKGRTLARAVVDLLKQKILPKGWLTDERWDNVWPVVSVGDPEDPTDLLIDQWPRPNIWLGVSIEDQATADLRIPRLLTTPAAKRFVSAEPLLGPVTIFDMDGPVDVSDAMLSPLHWVIVGGESGNAARSVHPDWVRSLRDQCKAAGTAFFFKQWGEYVPSTREAAYGNPRSGWRAYRAHGGKLVTVEELYPEAGAAFVEMVGKKAAGALLDGVEHREFPK